VGGKRAGVRQVGTTGKSGAAPKIVSFVIPGREPCDKIDATSILRQASEL
jgi:hypothetical protein